MKFIVLEAKFILTILNIDYLLANGALDRIASGIIILEESGLFNGKNSIESYHRVF